MKNLVVEVGAHEVLAVRWFPAGLCPRWSQGVSGDERGAAGLCWGRTAAGGWRDGFASHPTCGCVPQRSPGHCRDSGSAAGATARCSLLSRCHSSVLAALLVPGCALGCHGAATAPRALSLHRAPLWSGTFTNHISHFSHFGAPSGAGWLTLTLSSRLAGRAGDVQAVARLQLSWVAHKCGRKELL